MGYKDGGAEDTVADLVETVGAVELGGAVVGGDTVAVGELLGVAEEDNGLDLVADRVSELLDGAMDDGTALRVATGDNSGVGALRSSLDEEVLHEVLGGTVSATGEVVGGQGSGVGDTLGCDVPQADAGLEAVGDIRSNS